MNSKSILIVSSLILLILISVVGYISYHRFIRREPPEYLALQVAKEKTVSLYFMYDNAFKTEQFAFFSTTMINDCMVVINQWLRAAWHMRLIELPINCQSTIIDAAGSTVFISFDAPLLHNQWSIEHKMRIIKSLSKTVHEMQGGITHVYYLVRHQPMSDTHIDFSRPLLIDACQLSFF